MGPLALLHPDEAASISTPINCNDQVKDVLRAPTRAFGQYRWTPPVMGARGPTMEALMMAFEEIS